MHPLDSWFASSRWDGHIVFWNPDFSERKEIACEQGFASLALHGDMLLVALSDGAVSVYNVETGELMRELTQHEGMVFALAVSSSDEMGMYVWSAGVIHSVSCSTERMASLKFSD